MTERQRENYVYSGISLGCLLFLVWIIPANTPPYPGYGVPTSLLPNVAVGIILALALLSLAKNLAVSLREKSQEADEAQEAQVNPANKVHLLHLLFFMAPCILLMSAMNWIGFIPAGIGFLLLIQFLCGQRKPISLALVSVVPVLIMYAAMRYGLGVPLP